VRAGKYQPEHTFAASGSRSLTASHQGDASNTASTSGALAQTVGKATATLTSRPTPSALNQHVTLTAATVGHLQP